MPSSSKLSQQRSLKRAESDLTAPNHSANLRAMAQHMQGIERRPSASRAAFGTLPPGSAPAGMGTSLPGSPRSSTMHATVGAGFRPWLPRSRETTAIPSRWVEGALCSACKVHTPCAGTRRLRHTGRAAHLAANPAYKPTMPLAHAFRPRASCAHLSHILPAHLTRLAHSPPPTPASIG